MVLEPVRWQLSTLRTGQVLPQKCSSQQLQGSWEWANRARRLSLALALRLDRGEAKVVDSTQQRRQSQGREAPAHQPGLHQIGSRSRLREQVPKAQHLRIASISISLSCHLCVRNSSRGKLWHQQRILDRKAIVWARRAPASLLIRLRAREII